MPPQLPYRKPRKPTQFQYEYGQSFGKFWGFLALVGLIALFYLWPFIAFHGHTVNGGWAWTGRVWLAEGLWWVIAVPFGASLTYIAMSNVKDARTKEADRRAVAKARGASAHRAFVNARRKAETPVLPLRVDPLRVDRFIDADGNLITREWRPTRGELSVYLAGYDPYGMPGRNRITPVSL